MICISKYIHYVLESFCEHVCAGCPYHPELGGHQVGILHSGVESQDAIGAPAEQQSLKRSVGVELQRVKVRERQSRRDTHE